MSSAETLSQHRVLTNQVLQSESNISQAAERLLVQSGYPCLQGLTCRYYEGILTLHGSVPSYYMKQVAQTVVKEIKEVSLVDNRLHVVSSTKAR